MFEPVTMVVVAVTFLAAGAVKGVIGLGLPTVSLGVLAVAIDLPTAMALLLAPSFVTNAWQGITGGRARGILVRTWPFLLAAVITVPLGGLALTRVDVAWLSALLGLLLIVYGSLGLGGLRLSIAERRDTWSGPLLGAANGVLTGMTGSFVVPGVMYLQAIGLPRDALVQAMGILFTASTVALAVSLGGSRLLTTEQAMLSLAAVFPALVGMTLGRSIRESLSERLFRRVFFAALLALGCYIMWSAMARLT
ncbi:MAG: sulfite exporter TauE/SafE family protein [Alphaproteobacteria bacterium]|nr:sulfite exporter TauE/SafE family protein [Alphaproteobacteria bacterium]